ncbi:MAG: hypothetical protein SGI97_06480 [candidate division Zixibacteria bacterium]|nr:hypothetical protein [candidate division Zixibacteria bacterium]
MIAVIQCAASKRTHAGHLFSAGGKPVVFVADPEAAPDDPAHEYARPDDLASNELSWRQELLKYNEEVAKGNPLGLLPAYQLYRREIYTQLVNRFGCQSVYILSAGWGLIRADFLTPYYDITFSQSAERYKQRRKEDCYDDFEMLPDATQEDIVFFGGKDYLLLFCTLTDRISSRKTVFYNCKQVPEATGFVFKRFETTTRTNWHYECAKAYLDGRLGTL